MNKRLVTKPLIERKPTSACNFGLSKYGQVSGIEFKNYIQNKKVIIVGPAGYLKDQNRGEYINSFDIVVRINHAIPIKYPNDYGNRTDVLYHILSRRSDDGIHKKLVSKEEIVGWKEHGINYLVSRHDGNSQRIKTLKYSLYNNVKWLSLNNYYYRRIRKAVGEKQPNTGIVAMMHLLSLNPKSVNVVGFDFYRSGVYGGYGDIREGECANTVNSKWHDTEAQLKYLKKQAIRHKNLILDNALESILSEIKL